MALYSDVNRYSDTPGDLVTDVHAVYQHIDNLLTIDKRELLFNEDVGASLEPWLFEPVDEDTSAMLYTIIVDDIRRWDDRVDVLINLSTVDPEPDNNLYKIKLVFTIRGLGNEYEYSGQLISKYQGG